MNYQVHMVIDFMHIYYKYKFMADGGRMRRLSYTDTNGHLGAVNSVYDVTKVYYVLRDIENMVKQTTMDLNRSGFPDTFDVAVTICCDSKPTERQEMAGGDQYKANRHNKLSAEDLREIETILTLLRRAGYCVLQYPGVEADDLVNWAVGTTVDPEGKGKFFGTVIVTNDSDLLAQVRPGVMVRIRRGKEYTEVKTSNYTEVASDLMKTYIPYNAIVLYKCTVGDKSDNIPGVRGFGDKRWASTIMELGTPGVLNQGVKLEHLGRYDTLRVWLTEMGGLELLGLTQAQGVECLESLALVAPNTSEGLRDYILNSGTQIGGVSSEMRRQDAYVSTFEFKSLVW